MSVADGAGNAKTWTRRDHFGPQRYLQPGAPGLVPQPPAVLFTLRFCDGLGTTVPSCVVPWDVHSQKPPTGMWVAQVSLPAWQMFRAKAGVDTRIAAQREAATEKARMVICLSSSDRH